MADILVEYRATFADPERAVSTIVAYQLLADTVTLAELATAKQAWCDAVAPVSTAQVQECTATMRTFTSFVLPSQTVYGNIEDKAFFEFRSLVDGTVYSTRVPAPNAADFKADVETDNPTNAQEATFISWVEANGVTKSGRGSLKFILGYRTRASGRKERIGIPSAIG